MFPKPICEGKELTHSALIQINFAFDVACDEPFPVFLIFVWVFHVTVNPWVMELLRVHHI